MNKSLSLLLTTTALMSTPLIADTNKHEMVTKIQEQVSAWIDIQVTPQNSIIQKMVFNCEFYSATPYIKSPDGNESSSGSYLFYSHKGVLGTVTEPYTTQPLPELTMCLKKDFVITNQDEAQLLFEAIETVYPNYSMFDDNFPKEITKTPNGWQLVDGEIFDDKKGYVIETTPQGKVTKIIRSLNL
ncbi:hypothetical protein [Vibrio lentus]|uniref:hypothetical protein n=1 Tax=Vibrio lentus TaxID=136468 RepID=UPI000C82978C|nr:hypothetical protein [Vibrio lentus]PMJ79161.1 hypothetical protein BCU14_21880 [Vibrio lentus]PMN37056.1 hypothetical protein BCT33_03910 [Vibrio lentus]PMN63524.1 hypothetical protein BCT29_01440 [Vibrio lentus]WGS62528.1 hypothetical protein ISX51_21020 [Vibrio lentus]